MTIEIDIVDQKGFLSHSEQILDILFDSLSSTDWHYLNFSKDTSIWESKESPSSTVYVEYETDILVSKILFSIESKNTESTSLLLRIIRVFKQEMRLNFDIDSSLLPLQKILFVENHEVFAKTVIDAFLSDFEVTVSGEIQKALKFFQEQIFDVILVDYDLDDGKGSQFVMKVRALDRRVKIIAVSSHDMGNQEIMNAGGNVICKKSDFSKISMVLEDIFQQGNRLESPTEKTP